MKYERPGSASIRRNSRPVPGDGALLAAAGLVIITAGGCGSQRTLEAEHAEDLDAAADEPLTVIDYLPAHNTPGVPKNIQPYFWFNREIEDSGELELAVKSVSGLTVPFTWFLDFDNAGITFVPSTTVPGSDGDEVYHMALDAGSSAPLIDDSIFTTAFPDGLLFNMSIDLYCTQFGGSATQAALLNSSFEPGVYPLWIMVAVGVDANTQFPVTTDLMMGPAYVRSEGTYRIYRYVGLSTLFPDVTIEADGHFRAYLEGEFLPLDTPEQVVLTYMVKVLLEGTFDLSQSPARIKDVTLTGIFPTRSLLLLADESESYATSVNLVELDVDLNGNGTNDSATFSITSQPEELPPGSWDP